MHQLVGVGRNGELRNALNRLHAEHHRGDQDLHKLWMLNAVVVLKQDRRIPGANLVGQDLSGAHVVILIEVDWKSRRLLV